MWHVCHTPRQDVALFAVVLQRLYTVCSPTTSGGVHGPPDGGAGHMGNAYPSALQRRRSHGLVVQPLRDVRLGHNWRSWMDARGVGHGALHVDIVEGGGCTAATADTRPSIYVHMSSLLSSSRGGEDALGVQSSIPPAPPPRGRRGWAVRGHMDTVVALGLPYTARVWSAVGLGGGVTPRRRCVVSGGSTHSTAPAHVWGTPTRGRPRVRRGRRGGASFPQRV